MGCGTAGLTGKLGCSLVALGGLFASLVSTMVFEYGAAGVRMEMCSTSPSSFYECVPHLYMQFSQTVQRGRQQRAAESLTAMGYTGMDHGRDTVPSLQLLIPRDGNADPVIK